MALTKRQIDAAKYTGTGNARCVLWDDNPVGLGLRIYPSGRKAFVLAYRNANGVKRQPTLGDYGVFTLEDARRQAKKLLVSVDDKTDPLAQRESQRLEARTGTLEAVVRAYVEARTNDPDRPMKRPESVLWYADKFIFPRFGSRPWRDIRRSEVREWHSGIASAYNANRALQAMRAAYYWRLWQEDDAAGNRPRESDTRNPCAGIDLRRETKRQIRLELVELPRVEKAIDAETDDPYMQGYFRFVMATGCRKSEALKLRWSDVTLPTVASNAAGTVTFRDVKGGDDHSVPLSPYATALLRKLPRIEGNPFVFVGRIDGQHIKAPFKAWQRVRAAAGVSNVTIHDLRRTFGSWLGDAGFTSKQIGTTLGHRSDITSRVYMALGDTTKRAAVDAIGKLMTAKPARVHVLHRRQA